MTEPHCTSPARPIVLASASPRRRDLMSSVGLSFEVDASNADEPIADGAGIAETVSDLALAKALEVAPRHPDALIVAADTLVALDGRIFGKPVDRDDGRRMLQTLSGARHRVYTGLVVLDGAGRTLTRLVETDVYFRELPAAEIEAYLDTPEPYDKAGSYGMQGIGGVFVERIDGDASNVIGLPLAALNELLREAGCCIVCRQGA